MSDVCEVPVSSDCPDRTALLVVDVQQGLFDRRDPVYDGVRLLDTLNALIARAREAAVDVIYVQHANKTTLVKGSTAWQLHEGLLPPMRIDTVIHKMHGDAFKETNLHELLGSRGIGTLVITGLVTQGCIKATCEGALSRGYHVVLVEDGHSTLGRHGADTVAKWNKKLNGQGAELRGAVNVGFVGACRMQFPLRELGIAS